MEFKAFSKIERIGKVNMTITQKIHGTNAAILVFEYTSTDGVEHEPRKGIRCQSRTRFIYPGDDNYGFAEFVHANKEEFIEKLGLGLHYGEWSGPGINSGEGLKQKTFVLFDYWNWPSDRPLPPQTAIVPVLYSGPFSLEKIDEVMAELKASGSKLAEGFMRPEGVVVTVLGHRLKKVFEVEETQWRNTSGYKEHLNGLKNPGVDYGYLMQPIRLEKLLSRDERFVREFPKSLPEVVRAYMQDLEDEKQIPGDKDEVRAIRKGASSQIFSFIRQTMETL